MQMTDTRLTPRKASLKEWIYLDLTIVGILVPIWILTQGLTHMPSLQEIVSLATANHIVSGFTADLLISGLVLDIFILYELKRMNKSLGWFALFAGLYCCVGLSGALPCFLWLREKWERA